MGLMTKPPLNTSNEAKISAPVGDYLLDRLYELGVGHIFGIPGDYVLKFNKQIEKHKIKFINTTRENTAGYMADAYARLKGIGAVCITYGVGINITNADRRGHMRSDHTVFFAAPGYARYDAGIRVSF